jgi:hypothetical protein
MLVVASGLVVAGLSSVGASAGALGAASISPARAVAPKTVNNLDCNGWSKRFTALNPGHRMGCTDPRPLQKPYGSGRKYRFLDNGHYVGHDEPSTKFISSVAGSGNTMTYLTTLPVNPNRRPTPSGSVTTYTELSPALWFGLPLCDPNSYPQNPCTPDSDTNTGLNTPKDAGSAFMELQFYAPGSTPFQDNVSCSGNQWCAAMTIDSLSATFGFAFLNPNCTEPVNFAFLQRNGVPAGPPSPQLADASTDLPNAQTLKMNPGDVLKVSITDPAAGFTTTITDLTTGQTGFMVASAANGFMSTIGTGPNALKCMGVPFTFHAEYNTARVQNQVPWAALEGGVLAQQETGHFESCNSVSGQDPFQIKFADGQSFIDRQAFDVCHGGNEPRSARGEGPCNLKTLTCTNAQTEGTTGPIACPTGNFQSGQLCEFADGICFKAGTRTVVINGVKTKQTQSVTGCLDNRFQNGDLDFDGIPYRPGSWPNGSSNTPTSARYVGPFDPAGNPYPQMQFETDAPASEFLCNVFNGLNCVAPPLAAKFYPYWTMNNTQRLPGVKLPAGACVWNFGNTIRNVTTQDFGKDAEYGVPDVARFGGTLTSPVMANPEFSGGCPSFSLPS